MSAPKKSKVFNGKRRGPGKTLSLHDRGELYDSDWQSYRERFLDHNPHCYACGKTATVVDHIEPAQGNRELFEKLTNHAPLCAVCHNTVTSLFDRFHVRGSGMNPRKLKWLADQRAKRENFGRILILPYYRLG